MWTYVPWSALSLPPPPAPALPARCSIQCVPLSPFPPVPRCGCARGLAGCRVSYYPLRGWSVGAVVCPVRVCGPFPAMPQVWQRILCVRTLVGLSAEDMDSGLKFASLCRRSGRMNVARRVRVASSPVVGGRCWFL